MRIAPTFLVPFIQLARLDRPVGWQLLLAPCWWSSALASLARHEAVNLWHLALFLAGAIAMRGAGSTFNDMADRDLDLQVERTRTRPLPSGRVNMTSASLFLLVQGAAGLAVLLSFNIFTIWLGLASLILVAAYPFMKRITNWPQAVLGLAFAWGALMGWAAQVGAIGLPALWLYAAAIFWTIGYDTIYALQDTRDDAIVGIGSTARLFGDNVQLAVGIAYFLAIVAAAAALLSGGAGPLSYLGLLGFAGHLAWQVRQVADALPPLALRLFRANRTAGFLLFAGIATDVCLLRFNS